MAATPSIGPPISYVSRDVFLHIPSRLSPPSSAATQTNTRPPVIFFITGNPGLIAYYHAFLALLATAAHTRGCVVAGFSLGGFELEDHDRGVGAFGVDEEERRRVEELQFPNRVPDERGRDGGKLYGLETQIELTERRVQALSERLYYACRDEGDSHENDGSISHKGPEVPVILLGHSVGAYIVLELIRRHAQRRQQKSSRDVQADAAFAIRGAILLTPTVAHIAQSASGRLLTPFVTYVPAFAALVAGAARGLVMGLSRAWLRDLVRWVTGMPDMEGGEEGLVGNMSALDATVAFLRSPRGVRQALEMAADEMRTIAEDRWGPEVWGAGSAAVTATRDGAAEMDHDGMGTATKPPTLVFYFAKTDHWVADQTREELQRVRGRLGREGEDWRPKMVVDEEDGLVHGWCIEQSKLVADKVGEWIREIVAGGQDADEVKT